MPQRLPLESGLHVRDFPGNSNLLLVSVGDKYRLAAILSVSRETLRLPHECTN